MAAALDHSMTTTAFSLDGYRTTKTLGVVRGVTVRSRSIFGTIGGVAADAGRRQHHPLHRALREDPRRRVRADAAARARRSGANAVIGIRYDATEVMDGVTEVLCYGTAVVVSARMSATVRGSEASVEARSASTQARARADRPRPHADPLHRRPAVGRRRGEAGAVARRLLADRAGALLHPVRGRRHLPQSAMPLEGGLYQWAKLGFNELHRDFWSRGTCGCSRS